MSALADGGFLGSVIDSNGIVEPGLPSNALRVTKSELAIASGLGMRTYLEGIARGGYA
ncbi:hypothetical protein [Lichenicoccus sp.]|uniref:hypothetical protein n=1 Tax=Lichenicoccus sp. TaxID=2781899 RepID=UPI003D0FBA88